MIARDQESDNRVTGPALSSGCEQFTVRAPEVSRIFLNSGALFQPPARER
jgi:hypothetical protein